MNGDEKIKELEEVLKWCETELAKMPEGTLRISNSHVKPEYYWRKEANDTCGKYIKKSERDRVYQLAQKDYLLKLQNIARRKLQEMQHCKYVCNLQELYECYETYSPQRQALIKPYYLTDEMFVKKWRNDLVSRKKKEQWDKYPLDDERAIETERGEKVRSKSEKIIADKLAILGIPYIYEAPLQLTMYGQVHPDFTALNIRTRKTFYWEHFGMMNNPQYVEKAIRKIKVYHEKKMFEGSELIISYETYDQPLNMKQIEILIKQYLL